MIEALANQLPGRKQNAWRIGRQCMKVCNQRPYLAYSRNPAELALMRALKTALDPLGILNPGKVIPA